MRRGALLSGTQCASCGQRLYGSQQPVQGRGRFWTHASCTTAPAPTAEELVHEAVRRVGERRDVDPVDLCGLLQVVGDRDVRESAAGQLGRWATALRAQWPPIVDVLAEVASPWYVGIR